MSKIKGIGILVVLFLFFASCRKTAVNDIQSSPTIEFSRLKNLLIQNYVVSDSTLKVNGQNFSITDSWIEKSWKYLNSKQEIKILEDRYQLVIKVHPLPNDYLKNWIFSTNAGVYFEQKNSNIVLDKLPTNVMQDSIIKINLGVFNKHKFKENKTVDYFELIKM